MLLKSADDRAPDIAALEALRARPGVDGRTIRAIEQEIWAIRLGAKAESDAAYLIDFDLRDSKNWAVIHDLRLEVDGQVAQIDHLAISRIFEIYVCESKSFTGGVKVNEHGEWVRFHDRKPVGIPSPVEQNRRHIAVIERAIKVGLIKLPRRVVALKPRFVNIVLVSEGGTVGRPRRRLPELDAIVKADQFRTTLVNRDFPSVDMLKFIGSDTLAEFGRQLVALHRPVQRDWAARFGLPVSATPTPTQTKTQTQIPSPTPARRPWLVKFDGPCSVCGTVLAKGAEAIWRQRDRRMLCLACGADSQ